MLKHAEMPIEEYNLHLINRYKETISDGEGIRYSLYLAGCRHACPGCHNPESWDPDAGVLLTEHILADIIGEIHLNPLLDGITLTGGDPFYNPQGLVELLKRLKESTGLNIWCYTGYTLEEIMESPLLRLPLSYIDVLVDGRFVLEEADPTLPFRGSRNQRILHLIS